LQTIKNPFLISLVTTLVNVCSTPISFYIIERYGRRTILIWGAVGMFICEFIVGIIGVTAGRVSQHNQAAVRSQIAFICIYIFFFATTWGPGKPSICKRLIASVLMMTTAAWVVIGEIFPLPIRSRGVALSTASNWFWNCIITVITPYMVGTDKGDANLGSRVFFVWGSLCVTCWIYAYILIPETKGLSLEQVDRMMEETTPRTSAKWVPHSTYAADMGLAEKNAHTAAEEKHQVAHDNTADSAV
jgi:MFS family permease